MWISRLLQPTRPVCHFNIAVPQFVSVDTPLGYLKSYIILPSTIYGLADNPLVQAGIQNPQSIQIPTLIKASLGRKQAGVVGKGIALWPDVHIDDSKSC